MPRRIIKTATWLIGGLDPKTARGLDILLLLLLVLVLLLLLPLTSYLLLLPLTSFPFTS